MMSQMNQMMTQMQTMLAANDHPAQMQTMLAAFRREEHDARLPKTLDALFSELSESENDSRRGNFGGGGGPEVSLV